MVEQEKMIPIWKVPVGNLPHKVYMSALGFSVVVDPAIKENVIIFKNTEGVTVGVIELEEV